jgi:hypothetical protein
MLLLFFALRLVHTSLRTPGISLVAQEDYMSQDPHGSAKIIFSDLPASEALEWAKMMSEHSTVTFSAKLAYAGYLHIPVSFVMTEGDLCVPPELQQSMIDMMIKKAGTSRLIFI